ncbi:MAG: 2-hydroxyacid dehydrogenase [Acetobacteraceae bacterium]
MPKPALLVTRRLPPAVEARAAREFEARLNSEDRQLGAQELTDRAAGAAAILATPTDRLDEAVFARLPQSVRVLATFSVGFDHIDCAAAKARGIAVCNTPGVLSIATAELAMLLILAAARRAGEGERLVRTGRWSGWAPTQLLGTGVSGRRLGILGMGRIGRELARIARGFAMEVHYRDLARLSPEREEGAHFHTDDRSFLAASEILSLHAPGGGATRHWLNAGRIAMLPKGAIIANAARGTLVDDTALISALRSGQVAAAGLDVYDGEPHLNPEYLQLENVVLLPHLGSATHTTRDAMGFIALDGIAAVLSGTSPPNRVA